MTNPTDSQPLPPDLLTRDQQAQVLMDEANARKASTDADTSAVTLTQTKYKSLVPDLTGVAMNTVDDKSTSVAFSGLVTYSALHHAAEIIANRVAPQLAQPPPQGRPAAILVTSQSDLFTNDLLSRTVTDSLRQLREFTEKVLAEPPETSTDAANGQQSIKAQVEMLNAAAHAATASLAGAGAAAAAGLGPIGWGAAAAAAIPSIISLFTSTTTVIDHAEDISDLATTTSVVAAMAEKLAGYTVVHEDFRRSPKESSILASYRQLTDKRTALVFRQEQVQKVKNNADLRLSTAQQKQDAAKKADPPQPEDTDLAKEADDAQKASADAAASLSVISAAINSIDAFTTAVNATAAGSRSPLAITVLNELLWNQDGKGSSADDISYVLAVKGLGGESVEYTKDRHVGIDTYTTLADAPVAFMLYDLAARKIISSGIASGVSSVHGHLGDPPKGLIGPNSADVIQDQPGDTGTNQQGQPGEAPEPHTHWWNRWRQIF